MKSGNFGKSTLLKYRFLNRIVLFFLLVAVVTLYSLPAVAQEKQEQQEVSKEAIENFRETKKAAQRAQVDKIIKQDKTGTDPRVFSNKWMPYYRSTELENGLEQQDLVAFGTLRFDDRLGMFMSFRSPSTVISAIFLESQLAMPLALETWNLSFCGDRNP